jgi:hypothetical protein
MNRVDRALDSTKEAKVFFYDGVGDSLGVLYAKERFHQIFLGENKIMRWVLHRSIGRPIKETSWSDVGWERRKRNLKIGEVIDALKRVTKINNQ